VAAKSEDDCDEKMKTLPLITLIKRIFTDLRAAGEKKKNVLESVCDGTKTMEQIKTLPLINSDETDLR